VAVSCVPVARTGQTEAVIYDGSLVVPGFAPRARHPGPAGGSDSDGVGPAIEARSSAGDYPHCEAGR